MDVGRSRWILLAMLIGCSAPQKVQPGAAAAPSPVPTVEACTRGDLDACRIQCGGRAARSCVFAGRLVRGVDPVAANGFFHAACALDDADGCTEEALSILEVRGAARDAGRAAGLLRTACERGSSRGCGRLGRAYREGDGLEKDMARAAKLFDQGCLGGDPDSCAEAMGLALDGTSPPEPGFALKRLIKLCDANSMVGCEILAKALAAHKLVAPFSSLPWGSLQNGCKLHVAIACRVVGAAYTVGDVNTGLDFATGRPLLERGCNLGDAIACARLADAAWNGNGGPADHVEGGKWAERACTLGHARACVGVAEERIQGDGRPADLALGARELSDLCDKRQPDACGKLAYEHYVGEHLPRDAKKALEVALKGCELLNPYSCRVAGALFSSGDGTTIDLPRAAEFYQRGCDAGSLEACQGLAFAYRDGHGLPRDAAKSRGSTKMRARKAV